MDQIKVILCPICGNATEEKPHGFYCFEKCKIIVVKKITFMEPRRVIDSLQFPKGVGATFLLKRMRHYLPPFPSRRRVNFSTLADSLSDLPKNFKLSKFPPREDSIVKRKFIKKLLRIPIDYYLKGLRNLQGAWDAIVARVRVVHYQCHKCKRIIIGGSVKNGEIVCPFCESDVHYYKTQWKFERSWRNTSALSKRFGNALLLLSRSFGKDYIMSVIWQKICQQMQKLDILAKVGLIMNGSPYLQKTPTKEDIMQKYAMLNELACSGPVEYAFAILIHVLDNGTDKIKQISSANIRRPRK